MSQPGTRRGGLIHLAIKPRGEQQHPVGTGLGTNQVWWQRSGLSWLEKLAIGLATSLGPNAVQAICSFDSVVSTPQQLITNFAGLEVRIEVLLVVGHSEAGSRVGGLARFAFGRRALSAGL
jgi:hypothetical protein